MVKRRMRKNRDHYVTTAMWISSVVICTCAVPVQGQESRPPVRIEIRPATKLAPQTIPNAKPAQPTSESREAQPSIKSSSIVKRRIESGLPGPLFRSLQRESTDGVTDKIQGPIHFASVAKASETLDDLPEPPAPARPHPRPIEIDSIDEDQQPTAEAPVSNATQRPIAVVTPQVPPDPQELAPPILQSNPLAPVQPNIAREAIQEIVPLKDGPIQTLEPNVRFNESINPIPEPIASEPRPQQLSGNPWWYNFTQQPILVRDQPQSAYYVELDQLIGLSLEFSPNVQSILTVPRIQRAGIGVAQAELDPTGFAQSKYMNNSDPVGNTLTTGGPSRLEEAGWENSVGARDKMQTGGRVEWSQVLNTRDSNSLFFQPTQQADTRLTINLTQPLMRGAGVYYNTAAIRVAGLKTNASTAFANQRLQEHALNIINTYYELLLNRCLLAQAQNGQNRISQIYERIRQREAIDADRSQLSRSVAAIARLKEQIATLRGNIRSNQAKLRELVNSPTIRDPNCKELIPLTMPVSVLVSVDLESEVIDALQLRGDILDVQNKIEVARIERNIAVNELRPQLDAIALTYVRGLQGDYNMGRAYLSQFDTGRPSYYAGATYLSPYGNRAARSKLRGRGEELSKLIFDYEEAVNAARAGLESATYSSESLFEATDAAIQSTFATQDEVEHQMQMFLSNFDGKKSLSAILSDLLDAEQRLIQAENNWVTKHIQYMKALSQIKYESGTLLSIITD